MNRRGLSRRGGLCLYLLAGLAGHADALQADRAVSQYVHDRWGVDRGFPGGRVSSITQTADGYLWIGTERGLVRFDGVAFQASSELDPVSSLNVNVLDLAADTEGGLLILGSRTVLRYTKRGFEDILWPLRPREIASTAISRGRDGSLLVAGLANGLLRFRGETFESLVPTSRLPRSPVTSIREASDGRVWLGTLDEGAFYFGSGQLTPVKSGLPDPKVNSLLVGGGRDVWIATETGVVRWDGDKVTAEGVPETLRRVRVLATLQDRDANLWFATSGGLVRLGPRGVSTRDASARDARAEPTALFEDREGNLWIGGGDAIERLRDGAFSTFGAAEGVSPEGNGPVYVDRGGRTWFAPASGGLFRLKDGRVERVSVAGLDSDVVYSIDGDRDGLWLGRRRGGLTRLPFEDGLTARTYTRAEGLAANSVFVVHASADGTVWAGTLAAGLSRLRQGRFTTFSAADGLASDSIAAITEDRDGTLWIGTPEGLCSLSADGRIENRATGLPSPDVRALFYDSSGVLWVGTGEGLAMLASGRLQLPAAPPSLWAQVLGIAEDASGWIWLATSSGVLRASRHTLLGGPLRERDLQRYGPGDGLLGGQVATRHRCVVADPRGRVWFSLDHGLAVVDPARLGRESAPALSHVVGLSADGTPIDLGRPVHLRAGLERVSLSFDGVSLSRPERLRFRYRLDDFDRDWSEPTVSREAVYPRLGPGSYRFRVLASNADGLWNGPEAALGLDVAPLLWQTWWFRITTFTAFALTALLAYRLKLRQETERVRLRMEGRLEERERIARDLHDTLLQDVQGLILHIEAAGRQIPSEMPARRSIEQTLDHADQVLAESRERVHGLRTTAASARDLAAAIQEVAEQARPGSPATVTTVEGRVRELDPAVLEEAFSIGREALVNALTHSQGSGVEVEIAYDADHFRLRVRDNGRGVDSTVLEQGGRSGHWGLPGMRERARRIGASLEMWSRPGAGTEVQLIVPASKAYRGGRQREKRSWLRRLAGIP